MKQHQCAPLLFSSLRGGAMKIVVIGPGAMGCLLAASLALRSNSAAKGADDNVVWLLDRQRDRAASLTVNGVILEENGRQYHCRIPVTADAAEIGRADIILLCVKSHNVREAVSRAFPLLDDKSLLITLQNGIGHLAFVQEGSLAGAVAVGVSAQGATLLGPGHVRHAGQGLTRIGFLQPAKEASTVRLRDAADLLTSAGIATEVVDSILEHVWAKMFVNIGINALTALLGCQNGKLLESPAALAQLTDAVQEAEAVARTLGVRIAGDPVRMTIKVCEATRANFSSMLQDVRNRRTTEIDAINGALVEKAHRLRIPVPVNEKLVLAVKKMERSYGKGCHEAQ